jgi:hypothetical protein
MTTVTQEAQGTAAILAQEELQEAGIDTLPNGSACWHTSYCSVDHSW